MKKVEYLNNYKTIFRPMVRALELGWRWNRGQIIAISILTILLGSSAYLQYASFSKIVDEIIHLKEVGGSLKILFNSSILLLLTFLIPAILRELQQFIFVKLRFSYIRNLNLLAIEEQSKLDIATIESTEFQDLMTKANSRGNSIIYQTLEQGIRNLENISGIIVASIFILAITPVLFFVALFTAIPVF